MGDRSPSGRLEDADVRDALDAFGDLFLLVGPDGALSRWNGPVPEVADLDDLATATLADLVADDDAEHVRDAVARAGTEGRAVVEADLVTADEDVPYEFRLEALPDGGEAAIAVLGCDVAERRRVREDRRAILNRMGDAFFAVDGDWRLTYVNEAARPILKAAMADEREGEDLEGRHLWESIPDAVDTPFYDAYHEAMETQESVVFEEHYEPLDTWFEVRAHPSETGLSVYFRDITEQRTQEHALRERERVLRRIYDVTADTERAFEEQVTALLGIAREVIGADYGTLSRVRGEEYVFEVVDAVDDSVQAGDVVPLAATNCERTAATEGTLVLANVERDAPELTGKDGFREWGIASYLGTPVLVDGEVYGTFCVYDTEPREEFTDWEITLVDLMSQWVSYELTHRRTRERLERQNEQLEEFASIVSHDLRNPLNVLQGSLELAAETGEAEHFERCRHAARRMETLIEDLLTLARAGEHLSDPEPVALSDLFEGCWATVETGAATLDVEATATIRADPDRLRQLAENLVRNAVEHAGADVTVTVGDLEDGFYVADDGPGIPEDEREQVFEAGYSTAEDGTGFGLNIVRQVAEAHGWRVSVTESEGGGARFEFTDVEQV